MPYDWWSHDLQRALVNYKAYDMIQELKTMFEEQAKQELFETVKAFHAYKQEDGQSVSSYLLKMKCYLDSLERLGFPIPNEVGGPPIRSVLTQVIIFYLISDLHPRFKVSKSVLHTTGSDQEGKRVGGATWVPVTASQRGERASYGRSPVHRVHHSGQQLYIREGDVDSHRVKANPAGNGVPHWEKLWARPTVVRTPKGRIWVRQGKSLTIDKLDRGIKIPGWFESSISRRKKTKAHLEINGIRRKEGESVRASITRYTNETAQITRLNEGQRIAGFIHGVKIKSLVKFISKELLEIYDGLMEKVYFSLQAEETTLDGRPITLIDSNTGEKPQKGRPLKGFGKKKRERRDWYNLYKEPNLRILQSLTKSPREILTIKKVGKTFTKPPKMLSKVRDTSKYREFHQDYDHDTNACRELKNKIEEAVKSGKLTHLIKGIRRGKAKKIQSNRRMGCTFRKGRTNHRHKRGADPLDWSDKKSTKKEGTSESPEQGSVCRTYSHKRTSLRETKTQEKDDEEDFQSQEEKGKSTGWKLYTDGASGNDGFRVGLMIVSPEGMEITYALKFEFTATNNEAKYKDIKAGILIAKEMKIEEITVFVDSQLVANQVNRSYEEKHHHIKQYLQITKELLKSFRRFKVQYIIRNQDKKEYALRKLASLTFKHLTKKVLVEKLANKSIYEKQLAEETTKEENSWMTPIVEYLISGILPADKKTARKIRERSMIREIHEGSCRLHAGPRSIVAKATQARHELSHSSMALHTMGYRHSRPLEK
nr:reverse transcriptase domain-containing protein [Tanacetum cinerariifolium]